MAAVQPYGQLSVVAITNICNQRCIFCLDRDIQGIYKYSTEKAFRILREQAEKGSRRILFMGGEPSRRKDWLQILEECRRLGLAVTMATNGTSFADPDYARKLIEGGTILVAFSIMSHDQGTADFIAGNPRTWKDQQDALKNINELALKHPIGLQFKMVVNRWNYRHLPELLDYASSFVPAIDNVYYQFKNMREIVGKRNYNLSFSPRWTEAAPLLRATWDRLAERNAWYETDGFPLCCLPGHEHHSRELCDILRNRSYIGHEMRDGSYDHGTTFPGYEKPESCARCSLDAICAGVFIHHCAVQGTDHLVPQDHDPAAIVETSLKQTPMLMDEYCRQAGLDRAVVEFDLGGYVGRALEEITREHAGFPERKQTWEADLDRKDGKTDWDGMDLERDLAHRKQCLDFVARLAPELDLETPCAEGWYLVDVLFESNHYVLKFTNRKQDLEVVLRPRRDDGKAQRVFVDSELLYRVKGGADDRQKARMRTLIERMSEALEDRRIFPD